jgi:hypothetical protein
VHRIVTSVTGVAVSSAIYVNHDLIPLNIGFGCVITGTATYTVEHSFDDLRDPTITATWFPHPFVVAQTVSKDGNYAMPITAYRLNVSASTGKVVMTSLQGAVV